MMPPMMDHPTNVHKSSVVDEGAAPDPAAMAASIWIARRRSQLWRYITCSMRVTTPW